MTKDKSGDDPLWRLLDQAIEASNPTLLRQALGGSARHPALDHPIRFLTRDPDSPLARKAVTAHALAVWKFFSAAQSRVPELVIGAAEVCRALVRERAPLFSAAPGTGLEDDPGFALQLFVRRVWPSAVQSQVEELFQEYATAGFFDFDAPVQPEDSGIIGGLLPFDAAIRLGNAPAAAALVRAGCRTDNVATGPMGRSIDLMDYILKTAKQFPAETASSVAAALMDRAVGAAISNPASIELAPLRRWRASV